MNIAESASAVFCAHLGVYDIKNVRSISNISAKSKPNTKLYFCTKVGTVIEEWAYFYLFLACIVLYIGNKYPKAC